MDSRTYYSTGVSSKEQHPDRQLGQGLCLLEVRRDHRKDRHGTDRHKAHRFLQTRRHDGRTKDVAGVETPRHDPFLVLL